VNGLAARDGAPEVSFAQVRADREAPSPGWPQASARRTGTDNALEE
jgi:hypothetical protein